MGIGEFLKGLSAGSKADDPAELEAAIKRLEREKAGAEQAMAAITARRQQLLLDDRDSELDADERQAEKHYRVAEKVDAALPGLRERLTAAKNSETEKRWRSLREEYAAAALAYRDAMRVAVERVAALLAVNDRARAAGYETRVMAEFVAPPRMLSAEALAEFETALRRARMMAQPNPGPKPSHRPPAPAPKPAPKPAAPVSKPPKAAAPVKPAKPFAPPEPDEAGRVAIVILKSGLELEGRRRPLAGEIVRIAHEQAAAIVRSGSGDYAEAAL